MLTPQEVGEKAFQKSAFGGYSMTQVDEFLDVVTADYGVLYTENAVLKSKMKVLVDTVEEYRSTEEAMRKALMSAQRMADEMLRNAEGEKQAILAEAEEMAKARVASIQEERATEEFRLQEAQRAVLNFSAQARATYQRGLEFLDHLGELCPTLPVETPDEAAAEIEENVQRILDQAMADVAAAQDEEEESLPEDSESLAPVPQSELEYEDLEDEEEDMDFSSLDFGKDYQIK